MSQIDKKASVSVLMSTYNGEKYIQEQLDSIFNQKDVELKLIVRDDGSRDSTLDILYRNKKDHDNLTIIRDGNNLGSCKSFLKLISSCTDDEFYALSDQDDIWDEDKLITAIDKMKPCDLSKPVLYHSNLRIVDENNTFYRNSHSSPKKLENKYLSLIQGGATGCTLVYNHALAEIAKRVKPRNFSMHDTWLYIVSMLLGEVVYDFKPHINYRQHSNNVIGTSLNGKTKNYVIREIERFSNRKLQPHYDNAVELLRELGNELDEESLEKLLEIVNYKRDFGHKKILLNDKDFIGQGGYWKTRFQLLTMFGIL